MATGIASIVLVILSLLFFLFWIYYQKDPNEQTFVLMLAILSIIMIIGGLIMGVLLDDDEHEDASHIGYLLCQYAIPVAIISSIVWALRHFQK